MVAQQVEHVGSIGDTVVPLYPRHQIVAYDTVPLPS